MSAKASTHEPRLTIKQACEAFGVTSMTLFMWRKGTPTRTPLPVEIDNKHAIKPRVFVPVASAKAWARNHGLIFDPSGVMNRGVATKPGPKPRTGKSHRARKGAPGH